MTEKPRAYVVRDWPEFLQVVNRLRHDQDLSLRDLSGRTGSGRKHLGNQLLGKVLPLAAFAWTIAHALGYDIALIPRRPLNETAPGMALASTLSDRRAVAQGESRTGVSSGSTGLSGGTA